MCNHPSQVFRDNKWHCRVCDEVVEIQPRKFEVPRSFGTDVKLDEYQRMKLGWNRNEKSWEDNIRSRKVIKKNGQSHVVLTGKDGRIIGEMPRPTLAPPPPKVR